MKFKDLEKMIGTHNALRCTPDFSARLARHIMKSTLGIEIPDWPEITKAQKEEIEEAKKTYQEGLDKVIESIAVRPIGKIKYGNFKKYY